MLPAALFPVLFGGASVSPAASLWRSRLAASGSSIGGGTLSIMDREWFRPLQAEGLASKLLDYNWLVGPSDLTGVLVKPATLVTGDVLATNVNFVSGDYSPSSGLKGNGSNKRLNSKVALSAVNPNSLSFIWAGAEMDTTGQRRIISARDEGTQSAELQQSTSESIALTSGGSNVWATGAAVATSMIYVAGHNGTNATLMRNAGTPTTGSGAALTQWTASTTINYYCRNSAGSYFDFSSGRAVFVGIGSALTTAEAQRISALIRATVIALGGPTIY